MLLPELRIKRLFTEGCRVEGKLVLSSCLRLGIQLERDGARYIAGEVHSFDAGHDVSSRGWRPTFHTTTKDVRIITPITVLLTLVQMEKGEAEIHTSYLTSMDIWFVAMKAFSVMSLVESLAVLALIKRARGVKKRMIRAPNEYEREKLPRAKAATHSLMDAISRFLSPLIFIVFFVYYVLYITQRDETTCLGRSIFDIT
ncbi:Neur-chan-LBD domain-containing protein [Aphelenchoides fujianensis]|nr:Neur-chan-LBD domain-containing protein [Aphelenchoides fujianensis]